MGLDILYEDNHCIAVRKPSGLLTQSDRSGAPSLLDEVRQLIKERDAKPGNVFLGLVHRLDRNVGGIVLFGKTSKGAARLSEQFANRNVKKVYLAVVEGLPKPREGFAVQWLKKDKRTNTVSLVPPQTPDSKEARLSYRVVKTIGERSLVRIQLETGRGHQIRVAMQSLGTPVLGDVKYGASPLKGNEIALCASELTFLPPTNHASEITLAIQPESEAFRIFFDE